MNAVRTYWQRTKEVWHDTVGKRIEAMPKWARITFIVAFVVFLYALPNRRFYEYLTIPIGDYIPLYTTRSDMASVLFYCTWTIMLALGLNVVVGYAGLLDLGFFGFFAVGAYTTALLASPESKLITEYNWFKSPWPWLVTVPLAIALALLSGVLLGWPTLRLRGDYLAIVTLGFAEMIRIIARQNEWALNGDRGIGNIGHPPGTTRTGDRSSPSTPSRTTGWRSRSSSSWSSSSGTSPAAGWAGPGSRFARTRTRPSSWGCPPSSTSCGRSRSAPRSAACRARCGPGRTTSSTPTSFALQNSILVLAAVLLGGAGNIGGAILGGFLVIYVPEWLRTVSEVFGIPERVNLFGVPLDISATSLRYFLFGVILILVMIFRPQGIWPNRRRAAEIRDRAKEVAVGGV